MKILQSIVCVYSLFHLCVSVQVDTQYGPVVGRTTQVDNWKMMTTIDEFRGIPYAKDTSGDRRYRNPEEPDPWTEPLEAFKTREMCPQRFSGQNPGWEHMSEDCLHLDIFTPDALAGPNTYPVLFWIHGGAYQFGANIHHTGHFLASHGIVVVVINYRLGSLGFSFTNNDACPGNAGLWDQKMALDFVVNNIANFAGDPNRITVSGHSAGASSTGLLLVSPQTKGSFQQAILQSGNEFDIWAVSRPESHPENFTYQVAEHMDCPIEDDYEMMDCLRSKPWKDIVQSRLIRCSEGYICIGMGPVVDGTNGFLPKMPIQLRLEGDIMTGPIITGIAKEDGAAFLPIAAPGVVFDGCCDRERFETIVHRLVNFFESRLDGEKTVSDVYEALDWNYSPWPHIDDTEANRQALVKIVTDVLFGVAWNAQLKDHYALSNTFGFVFDYKSKDSNSPEWMGVTHGGEVGYVWGNPMLDFNEHIRNDTDFDTQAGDNYELSAFNDEDLAYSYFMQELWTNFVKFGDPTFEDVENPLGGSTVWPKFDRTDYGVLYFNNDVTEPIHDYREQDYAFWTRYIITVAFDIIGPLFEETGSMNSWH